MKTNKMICAVAVFLFVLNVILIGTSRADIPADATAKDKLPIFLKDVIELDLTKYNKTNEGYDVSYPSEFGGLVKEEHITFTLEFENRKVPVSTVFYNGYIAWLNFYPINGSLIYKTQPSKDALDESRNILLRYQEYCHNYGVNASHVTSALTLLNSVPASPSTLSSSPNINGISNFTPANVTLGNMKLGTSETGIGVGYTIDGFDVLNKGMGMDFGYNTFVFSDTWNLYNIGTLSALSKEEAMNIAFNAAKNFCANLQVGTSNGPTLIKPEWSQRQEIGLLMIPGQIYNNSADRDLHYINVGNATRDPLMLYPFWQAIFYFTEQIGSLAGIQVGIWGDTKEIAYCDTYGFLGSSNQLSASPSASGQPSTSTPDNSDQTSKSTTQLLPVLPVETLLLALLVVTVVLTLAVVFIKKRHK